MSTWLIMIQPREQFMINLKLPSKHSIRIMSPHFRIKDRAIKMGQHPLSMASNNSINMANNQDMVNHKIMINHIAMVHRTMVNNRVDMEEIKELIIQVETWTQQESLVHMTT